MAKIKVIMPGILTTVQDHGRIGYQKFGISQAGVMDEYNYELANALVGNDVNEAVLETTFVGPTLEFEDDLTIAITGANMQPKLDGEAIENYQSYEVKAGQKLSFGKLKEGLRGYIAFGGTFGVEEVNGSKSTLLKSQLGGFEGRALKSRDVIEIHDPVPFKKRILDEKYVPKLSQFAVLRVVFGPQDDAFTEKGKHTFLYSGGYTLTKNADRMGMRFNGPALDFVDGADIISDATVMGSVQVPAEGKPIVLMADRQTTGGYTKVATVVTPDLSKLAQLRPGAKVLFDEVTPDEGEAIYKTYRETLNAIRQSLK
ncbi:biotin-dependent carboxyltransferase family protein [Peptoniphilus equinus]|uniref:Biotin-dependent carboxyltransferase family protein n=1 Tax=Peptoniphilus equinus TaxID=3016343 RepID=A0ABY7QTT9_9FIRM|nr:biotin-dependent carboxyltransferase family protein [Peptoniphilus equinus]WBW49871.1 biotin-dependent carboxyltransferase family protein [Peptoniphilus equinus]